MHTEARGQLAQTLLAKTKRLTGGSPAFPTRPVPLLGDVTRWASDPVILHINIEVPFVAGLILGRTGHFGHELSTRFGELLSGLAAPISAITYRLLDLHTSVGLS